MDAALHRAGVTFVLDRAGITGDDGASHNGMWDLSMLQLVPGLRIAAPRDGVTLVDELREAVGVPDAPTVVRFPKGPIPDPIPALERIGGVDVLRRSGEADVLVVGVGVFAGLALEVADRLAAQGLGVTVVDPRWVKPVPEALLDLVADHRYAVVLEDGIRTGGVGDAVARASSERGCEVPVRSFGVPEAFLDHGKRVEILAECGLTAQDIARAVTEDVAGRDRSDTLQVVVDPDQAPRIEQ
jgi:1-deoxy-D-xylulose-5-phosphate synthase